ncbi:MAG TPA: DUF389 domain-containing protein [Baekduia sp.]|nr:DUF389 domain-containing protein [Baekduia sp.]
MVHLRIVAPAAHAVQALRILEATESVVNVVHLEGAARKPAGDVVLADVAREDASVVIADLRHLGIAECGSISIETIETQLSQASVDAERAAAGVPGDAVIWEEVVARTSEESTLSGTFLAFMVLAMLIASVGIFLDSPILVVGAMVVGPEFGPIAAFCVALVQRRGALAARSLIALVVGFPLGIAVTVVATWLLKETGVTPGEFNSGSHSLSNSIANPDFLAFFVAFCAGIAGMLSLTTAKSGALIGVLVSVTTIPAAANIAVAFVYGDWASWRGSQEQLLLNIAGIHVAGVLTLLVQRRLYVRRRRRHRARMRALGIEDTAQ